MPSTRHRTCCAPTMDRDAFDELLSRQEHVFTRQQVFRLGGDDNLLRRSVRRREWVTVWPGVLVDHTGELTAQQQEWAAVLYYAPAALTGHSALQRYGMATGRDAERSDSTIHVAVDRSRRVGRLPGVRVTRMTGFAARVLHNLSPPRVRLEHAVLDLAASAGDDLSMVAVLADACGSRRTTARRLLAALDERPRLPGRRLIRRVLTDIATGTDSVLEWLYLTRVERPHGLPAGRRQRVSTSHIGGVYRDVEYEGLGLIVELDGRTGHSLAADRWDDLDRDVDAAVRGRTTLRLGWRQVLDPCRTAAAVARVLGARGWPGQTRTCSPTCRRD